jgi:putative endonuclease
MNYYVYILYSNKDHRLYVGCTNNLETRLKRHNSGQVKAMKHRLPLTLIYQEEHVDKAGAFNRERFLKSLWGAREKQKIKQIFLDSKRGQLE